MPYRVMHIVHIVCDCAFVHAVQVCAVCDCSTAGLNFSASRLYSYVCALWKLELRMCVPMQRHGFSSYVFT